MHVTTQDSFIFAKNCKRVLAPIPRSNFQAHDSRCYEWSLRRILNGIRATEELKIDRMPHSVPAAQNLTLCIFWIFRGEYKHAHTHILKGKKGWGGKQKQIARALYFRSHIIEKTRYVLTNSRRLPLASRGSGAESFAS